MKKLLVGGALLFFLMQTVGGPLLVVGFVACLFFAVRRIIRSNTAKTIEAEAVATDEAAENADAEQADPDHAELFPHAYL